MSASSTSSIATILSIFIHLHPFYPCPSTFIHFHPWYIFIHFYPFLSNTSSIFISISDLKNTLFKIHFQKINFRKIHCRKMHLMKIHFMKIHFRKMKCWKTKFQNKTDTTWGDREIGLQGNGERMRKLRETTKREWGTGETEEMEREWGNGSFYGICLKKLNISIFRKWFCIKTEEGSQLASACSK